MIMDLYFLIFAALATGAGIFTIVARDALSSALGLLTVFIALASLYLHLHAPLLAIFQVTIYAGAILVLVIFVIMLLLVPGEGFDTVEKNVAFRFTGAYLAMFLTALLIIGAKGIADVMSQQELPADFGSPSMVGDLFFREYILHFEMASILLLVAMIAGIYLAKRKI